MRLYQNVEMMLFYTLPLSHLIKPPYPPHTQINNALEVEVNVCDEK